MNNEFENLSQEARGVIESETYIAKQIIWNFYSRKYGVKFEEFECNEICVNYIEDYLKQRIRPRILKWNRVGDQIIITRVKTLNGMASSNDEKIQGVFNLVMACSILLGQCIATIFDGKWNVSGTSEMSIDVFDTSVQIYWKCLKYVTLGDEDGLVGYIKSIRYSKENKAITDQVLKRLNIQRQDYKRVENLMDDDGKLETVIIFDADDEVIATVYVGTL